MTVPIPARGGAASAGSAPVILVVDDDRDIREAVGWLLQDEGFAVEMAADGDEAVERATQVRPALLVLDLGLPILSGEEVAERLQALYGRSLPIVIMTAAGDAAEKAQRINAAAYVTKPFELDDLVRAIRNALEPA